MMMYKNIFVLRKFMLKYLQIKGAVYNLVSNSAKKLHISGELEKEK